THLDRLVSVRLLALFLHDMTRTNLDDGDGHKVAPLIEDLRHSDLGAKYTLRHNTSSLHAGEGYSLISMSTPAGKSSRMSASTVLGVGSKMSIKRLCVRISNCSRESLCT